MTAGHTYPTEWTTEQRHLADVVLNFFAEKGTRLDLRDTNRRRDFVAEGLLDSMGILELVLLVETCVNCTLDAQQLEAFRTVDNVVALGRSTVAPRSAA
ncbi:MAG: hypothetical protein AB7F89_09180 [Pirellulaceae bacterium]